MNFDSRKYLEVGLLHFESFLFNLFQVTKFLHATLCCYGKLCVAAYLPTWKHARIRLLLNLYCSHKSNVLHHFHQFSMEPFHNILSLFPSHLRWQQPPYKFSVNDPKHHCIKIQWNNSTKKMIEVMLGIWLYCRKCIIDWRQK